MIRITRACVLVLCLVPMVAGAQMPKETSKETSKATANSPAAVPSTPERTTASFGDWVLRSEGAGAAAQAVRDVAQVITLQGHTSPTAQVALGGQAHNESKRASILLPPNIT